MEKKQKAITVCSLNSINTTDRKVTDKYGLAVLLFTFSLWVASCAYVICNRYYLTLISVSNIQVEGDTGQYFKNKTWLFDLLTYDFTVYNDSYFFVRFARKFPTESQVPLHVFVYFIHCKVFIVLLLINRFPSRKQHFIFYMLIIIINIGFIIISIIYRLGLNYVSDVIPDQTYYKKFAFWVMPELMISISILIVTFIMFYVDAAALYSSYRIMLRTCCSLFCVTLFAIFLIMIMISIKILTTWLIKDLTWTHLLLYVIITGSFYVAFFTYNFGNAVIMAAIAYRKKGTLTALLLGIYVVTRYHIGSVGFHSTLFPPLIVIKNTKLEELMEFNNLSTPSWISELPSYDAMENDESNPQKDSCIVRCLKKAYELLLVFNRSLIFVAACGLSYRESSKLMSFRYASKKGFPVCKMFVSAWVIAYFILQVIHYPLAYGNSYCYHFKEPTSRVSLYHLDDKVNDPNYPYAIYVVPIFRLIGFVAYYFKISSVSFLLGMMVIYNYELVSSLQFTEFKEK